MNHSALTPVFTALRLGLHIVFTGLILFVMARAILASVLAPSGWELSDWIIVLGVVLLMTYASASFLHLSSRNFAWTLWLSVLILECLVLMVLTPDAAYLVFPLFFLLLHLIPQPWSILAVVSLTVCAILALAWHQGFSVGVIVGPIIGVSVAIAIGLGYRALFHEARERDALIHDLVNTRAQLASTEREAGMLAERSRLAREIHDTVAQGLSSIQLLLYAVERADENHPAIEHVRLARETAATNLAETRRFIRELTPPSLDQQTLVGALQRLAQQTTLASKVSVHVTVSGDPTPLPMSVETALLRIAQGSLSNVVQHAQAHQVELTLSYMDNQVSLDVVDDGLGFDASVSPRQRHEYHETFGLSAIRQRALQFGGSAVIESAPGKGTAVAVSLPLTATNEEYTP